MNTEALYGVFQSTGGKVCTDTRKIIAGSIFFALKGENFDGNLFAAAALEQGAVRAVVDGDAIAHDDRLIHVKNTLSALQDLARYHRRQLKDIQIIALTGSNGKTTTKELLAAVLSKKYLTAATEGNLNNHLGVPLTLLKIKPGCRMAVVEMGANHVGEIAQLCRIAEPDAGLISNIGKAHLEGFGGIEGVKKGKGELYDWLKSGGHTTFVNKNDEVLTGMVGRYENAVFYGSGDGCLVTGSAGTDGQYATLHWNRNDQPDKKFTIRSRLTGIYNASNMLAAVCVGSFYEVDPGDIVSAIENYIPANNRSQLVKSGSNLLLLDHYNANPTSMAAALENFSNADAGPGYSRRIVILGDMLELGKDTEKEHQVVADRVAQMESDSVFVGKQFAMCSLPSGSKWFKSSDEAVAWIKKTKPAGCYILVKGSRGIRLEKLVSELLSL